MVICVKIICKSNKAGKSQCLWENLVIAFRAHPKRMSLCFKGLMLDVKMLEICHQSHEHLLGWRVDMTKLETRHHSWHGYVECVVIENSLWFTAMLWPHYSASSFIMILRPVCRLISRNTNAGSLPIALYDMRVYCIGRMTCFFFSFISLIPQTYRSFHDPWNFSLGMLIRKP